MEYLSVIIGGGIGAVLRYLSCSILKNKFGIIHWATFGVNVTGCFLLGLASGLLLNNSLTAFLFAGVIGSFTTFSAFEYDNINLIAHEKYCEFLKYTILTCTICILAMFIGFKTVTFF